MLVIRMMSGTLILVEWTASGCVPQCPNTTEEM